MTLRTIAEMGGALGWLLVAFGSPLLLAMCASGTGGSEFGESHLALEQVPAVQFASLTVPKVVAVEPRASKPSAPEPPLRENTDASKRAAVAPADGSRCR